MITECILCGGTIHLPPGMVMSIPLCDECYDEHLDVMVDKELEYRKEQKLEEEIEND